MTRLKGKRKQKWNLLKEISKVKEGLLDIFVMAKIGSGL